MAFFDDEVPDLPPAKTDIPGRFLPVPASQQAPSSWFEKVRSILSDVHAFGRAVDTTTANIENKTVLATGSATRRTLGARFADTFNVRDFGASPSATAATNVTAIRAAIAAAVAAGGGRVYVPAGAYLVDDNFTFTSAHSNITLAGDGPGSVLKLANTLNAGNVNAGWLLHLSDTATAIRNLVIRDLRLDGSRATSTWGSTSHGVVTGTSALLQDVVVRGVTAHGFLTSGFQLFSGPVRLVDVNAYDNAQHGVGVSTGATFGQAVEVYGLTATSNVGYGLDVSKGRALVQGLVARSNTAGGAKVSENCEYLQVDGALLESNTGPGFQNTGTAASLEFYGDNIITKGNGGYGFRLHTGKVVQVGRLVSIANNGLASGGISDVSLGADTLRVDSLYVADAPGGGAVVAGTTRSFTLGHVEAVGNATFGLRVLAGAASMTGVVGSGIFRNNNLSAVAGASGAALQWTVAGSAKLRGLIFEDTQGTPTQVAGMNLTSAVQADVDGCHFGTGIAAGEQVYSSTAGTRVRFGPGNAGIVTRARGTHVGNGSATTYSLAFPTGLSAIGGAVFFAQVSPASADARGDHYVSAATYASATVIYGAATAAGTGNVSLRYDVEMEVQR